MQQFLTLLIAILLFAQPLMASNDFLELPNIKDEGSTVTQTSVFLNELECQAKMPKNLRPLLMLPKTQHRIVDPLDFYEFKQEKTEQIFYAVNMDTYAVIEAKHFETIPFIVTNNLCECVGVSIYIPGDRAGVMHAGFKSTQQGLLVEFINRFDKAQRGKAQVTLTTSYCTVLLREVYDILLKNGFKVASASIHPVYLNCKNRTSDGTKFFSYERLGFTAEDIKALRKKSAKEKEDAIFTRATLSTSMVYTPKLLILDLRNGDTCQLFGPDFGRASSDLITYLFEIYPMVQKMDISSHKVCMQHAIKLYAKKHYKATLERANEAMISMGVEMDGLEKLMELYTADASRK